MISQTHL